MANEIIEMDNFDREDQQENVIEEREADTNIDDDLRDNSMVVIDTSNPNARPSAWESDTIPDIRKNLGAMRRVFTIDKKRFLRRLNININKGDEPFSKSVFEKLEVTENSKGQINGAKYNGTKIIILKGKRLVFSEDVKKRSAINEFKELVEKAKTEHAKTPAALVEENLQDLDNVSIELTSFVLRDSLERLDSEISEKADEITNFVDITENQLRELRAILAVKGGEEKINFLELEKKHWKEKADREADKPKAKLYEVMADLADLKAD